MKQVEYLIMPIRLQEFKLHSCDGTFAGNQPFLRQKDGSYELKPDGEVYIGTALDGERSFIPVSTVSSRGRIVTPNENGGVSLNLTLPME
jgi:hypothetical protein